MGQSCDVVPQEIIYVIGGFGWKARFINQDGYIVTNGVDGVDAQYNLANEVLGKGSEWVPYQPDQESPKPYDCGRCHTTGFAEEGAPPATGYLGTDNCNISGCHGTLDPDIVAAYQEHGHGFKLNAVAGGAPSYPFSAVPNPPDGFAFETTPDDPFSLPGIKGTWVEPRVGCEACHGPYGESGENHPYDPEEARDACVNCHTRADIDEVDVSGGLIRHHEQYEMWLASPHNDPNAPECTDCHDPQASTIYDDLAEGNGRRIYKNEDCLECHGDGDSETGPEIPATIGEEMEELMCIDCHMPYAVKSATSKTVTAPDGATVLIGDLRAHLWKINAEADSPDDFFTDDGNFVAVGSDGEIRGLTLNFACQQCHSEGGITPHGLPAAEPKTFSELKESAPLIHAEQD